MADSKKLILETALKLFLNSPYKEVSLRDIVNKVGLTKGAFYHYYVSKEQLFEEVVKYFYNNVIITDYRDFPETSLQDFYNHYLKVLQEPDEADESGDMNFFVFVSEASKRVPNFLEIHLSQREKELKAWSGIVHIAKQNKEIETNIPDEDIAYMFLNISDGISMNKAFNGKAGLEILKDLKRDWDNLYTLIKSKNL